MNFFCDIQNQTTRDIPASSHFNSWVKAALQPYKSKAEVCICIVTPEESQELNYRYRAKNKPTNVLSFPLELPDNIDLPLLGDLVVCADIVKQEALAQNKQVKDHWAHMIIHGCLHLIGFDHIKDNEAEEMEQIERQILSSLGIDDPYKTG